MKKPEYIPLLSTERLFLREITLLDAPIIEDLAGDEKVAETALHIPHPFEPGLADQWIMDLHRKLSSGEEVVFGVTLKPFEAFIGAVGLTLNALYNHAELGYWIGREYWGKGYATEAVNACVEYGFRTLELKKIYANCLENNTASRKILLKLGMKEEGCLRSHVFHWGEYCDLLYFGLLAEEYDS